MYTDAVLLSAAALAWHLSLDTYTNYTDAQIAGLLRFANQTGKGLLVAGGSKKGACSGGTDRLDVMIGCVHVS